MTIEPIKADAIYDHNNYGDVLVSRISTIYTEWYDTDSPKNDTSNTVVFFYDNFDGYGGLNPHAMSQPVDKFRENAQLVELFEYGEF